VIWLTPNELDEVIRQLGGDLDGREIDLRQRRHRQPQIAEDAAQQDGDPEQRCRDRAVDER
jgi:hypothetical protein